MTTTMNGPGLRIGRALRAVADANPDALTVRVCWVFSGYADNFVAKMISLARDRPQLRVVDDQVGPPTYAPDIASALLRIAGARGAVSGLLHLASPDEMDRASMARAIMAESKRQGGPFAEVEAVSTAEFAAPAPRPLNARLSGAKATQMFALGWTPCLGPTLTGVIAVASATACGHHVPRRKLRPSWSKLSGASLGP